ncbi:MAG: hypothetical protein EOO93_27695 [Pedobacter sp.]|nr:MAG: hypothetical protein EOO93_27695 [Pedobacter sp.]
MKNKNRKLIFLYVSLVPLSVLFIYIVNRMQYNERENAPIIRFEESLGDVYVKTISFERNGLYLNNILYNAGGISGYSRLIDKNRIVLLEDIQPPFILRKKDNNDTLELVKGDQRLFLNVTNEIKWAQKQ